MAYSVACADESGHSKGGGTSIELLSTAMYAFTQEGTVMLFEYVRAAMKRAKYEILEDDDSFYGEIKGFDGVYANADTLEDCRDELQEVLEVWLLFRISRNLVNPVVDGISLKIEKVA